MTLNDTESRIAEQMPSGPHYGPVGDSDRKRVRRKYRLFGMEFKEEIQIPPESLRKWLNGSPVVSSKSIATQLVGRISEKRIEQIRTYAFPELEECNLLSEFFGGYKPEDLLSVVFRHHLYKAKRVLENATVAPPSKVGSRRYERVLCLVDRRTAKKHGYPTFKLFRAGQNLNQILQLVNPEDESQSE